MSDMIVSPTADERRAALEKTRARTFQLFDLATSEDVLHQAPLPGFRPVLWHLAHIGVFEGYWVLQQALKQASIDPRYDILFDPIKTPRENAKVLPKRDEMESYLNEVRDRVLRALEATDRTSNGNVLLNNGYVFDLVLEHERQHQETLAALLNAMPHDTKRPGPAAPVGERRSPRGEIAIPAASVRIGGTGKSFEYDNELPAFDVDVPAFRIDTDLVTNGEYADFIASGGYTRREWWSDDGWKWKEENSIAEPLGWSGPPWIERRFFDEGPLRLDAPVTGISWFEADAYARSQGKRLPTEIEWETAASVDPGTGRKRQFPWGDGVYEPKFANAAALKWATTPVGSFPAGDSAVGLRDAAGNLWEWTSSDFQGYPGFAAYPYPDYSQTWFDGDHRVARGGSWFTDPAILRASFRNFYRRNFRLGFLGIRCARDGD
ncbi:MAG TPA: SUMF1/EgtB/PvdO family nonheme iron enzyme [Candidatus Eremiobacteraceae bacterium]|nr:SUMF1/EgtB/PvdO family nonheme iron enzyme [Candidatus Eremiobacteraceae bacterium]